MKTKMPIIALLTIVVAIAQTVLVPVHVDWRYKVSWDDVNPAGSVARWIVYATNSVMGMRSISASTTNASVQLLLNGMPAGTYTIYTTAISALGAESDPGAQCAAIWPGGDGKLRGGGNPHFNK